MKEVPTSRACSFAGFFRSTEKWISFRAFSSIEMVYGLFVSGFTHFPASIVATSLKLLSNSTSLSLSDTCTGITITPLDTLGIIQWYVEFPHISVYNFWRSARHDKNYSWLGLQFSILDRVLDNNLANILSKIRSDSAKYVALTQHRYLLWLSSFSRMLSLS